jgi:type IX secretion system PorP/SprF family membrane protein
MRLFSFINILVLWLCQCALAQQRPHYGQYNQNYFLINPAIAGLESYADARVGFRQQWVGLEGAPRTFYTTAHVPVGNNNFKIQPASTRFSHSQNWISTTPQPDPHGGAGVAVVSDQAGLMSRLTMLATGAVHYPVTDDWQLSLGLSGGATQYLLDFDQLRLANAQDPVARQGKVSTWRPELAVGLWAYSSKVYAGLSVQQLMGKRMAFKPSDYNWQSQVAAQYFGTVGYKFDFSDYWQFIPSILIKYAKNQPISGDLNLKINYLNMFSFGASYRYQDAVAGWAGVRLAQKFMFSYSYEANLTGLQNRGGGSHELVLGITLGNKFHYASPRLFW